MVEPEKPMKMKELIRLDEEIASKLQAEFDEEAKIEVDHELAQRLKYFAEKRVEEKRNKPPTQAQQRKIMCTYLKNVEGKKPKDLKNKSFDSIQKMFDRAFKRQKVDDDKETVELKSLMKVLPDKEEVALDAIPLAVKSPSILDHMLKSFNREDLETLYKLVKAKYGSTRTVKDLDLVLYGDLKTMFEPHVEDKVWKNQSDYRVLDWKLYGSCGVHSLRKQNVHIHMLVEKRYPLTAPTITDLLTRSFRLTIAVKWHISFLNFLQNSSRINEVFGSILLVIMKILMKKLDDFGDKYQV
ncbi:hypothetical protein Tco_0738514 [Tanacetum coccineum]